MSDVLILGTDTDAGKTTFALLWLTAFADAYEYWKPVETGPSDSDLVRRLVPATTVHPPVARFAAPVAPPLAARQENGVVPDASTLVAARPAATRSLLVESFGSPFSPLNETQEQIGFLRELPMPSVLVSRSSLGAIGRTLQCLHALEAFGMSPRAVVLLGTPDAFAVERIARHSSTLSVVTLEPPTEWTSAGLAESVSRQREILERLRQICWSPGVSLPHDNLVERDRHSVWHPYTPLVGADAPLVCKEAQDEFLVLEDDRRIIDGISSWWTILHGHRFAPLMKAWREAVSRFDHVQFAGVTHEPAVELAELLLARLWHGGRVFYSDNGSTAVEVALKMAYQYWCHLDQPHRRRFVGFEHGYHGDTFGAMAVSRDPVFFGRFEPLLLQADILPLDAARLDEHLTRHAAETAGVIVEPLVQGAGGMRMHSLEQLRQIFEVTRKHDVLFIADEVMTGGGRTGHLWAHQAASISPDLICAGKALTGGIMPLAATLVSPRLVKEFDTPERTKTFFHGHSFTAHPPACAVAVANWRLLESTRNPARDMEPFWQTALAPLSQVKRVVDVRVRGSIAAVELDAPGGYLADIGKHLKQSCLDDGVFLRPLGNVLYAMPPLRTSRASLERIAAAMIRAVTTLG